MQFTFFCEPTISPMLDDIAQVSVPSWIRRGCANAGAKTIVSATATAATAAKALRTIDGYSLTGLPQRGRRRTDCRREKTPRLPPIPLARDCGHANWVRPEVAGPMASSARARNDGLFQIAAKALDAGAGFLKRARGG